MRSARRPSLPHMSSPSDSISIGGDQGLSSLPPGRSLFPANINIGGDGVPAPLYPAVNQRTLVEQRRSMKSANGCETGVLVHWPIATPAAPVTVRQRRLSTTTPFQ